jgi:hypothetical protein
MEKYSILTKDRSGAQIQDMLYAYSYCHKNNLRYMGACDAVNHKRDRDVTRNMMTLRDTNILCDLVGIPKPTLSDELYKSNDIIRGYVSSDTKAIFTDDFIKILHDGCKNNLKPIKEKDDFVISLHIRRGDVQKDNRWFFRYVDDDYYLKILKEVLKIKPYAKIYLFTDGDEEFEQFKNLGCVMMVNTDLVEAWNFFIQSDLLIMGSSSFSIVPGIFNVNGIVVYTWNKYFSPLDNWISDNDLNNKINKVIELLQK